MESVSNNNNNGHTTKYMVNGEWITKEKIGYPNDKLAIEQARKMNLMPSTIHKVIAYKCKVCGQWHVGRSRAVLTEKDRQKYRKALQVLNI